jgi:hypothetical protein
MGHDLDVAVSAARPRRITIVSRLAFAVLLLAPALALADGFAWTAPAGCPTSDDVRARIDRRLSEGVEPDQITVDVIKQRGRFVATISTPTSERTVASARCTELADAVAVIVARLATEQHAARPVVEPVLGIIVAVAPKPPVPPLAASLSVVERDPVPEQRVGKWGGGLRLLGLSGIGIMPRVGIGTEAAGYLRRNDVYGEVGYARWRESSVHLSPGAPGGVVVGLQMLNMRGGWASRRMPLRAWAGVEIGEMTGAGVALLQAQIGEGRWTAIASGFGVGWPIAKHVRLVGTFELAAPIQRARFLLGDGSEIYQPSSASARCALGFEVGWR